MRVGMYVCTYGHIIAKYNIRYIIYYIHVYVVPICLNVLMIISDIFICMFLVLDRAYTLSQRREEFHLQSK